MGGYAPAISPDEDEERRRQAMPYPPVDDAASPHLVRRSGEPVDASAISPAPPAPASAYPSVAGTEDLERRGGQLMPYHAVESTPAETRLKSLTDSGAPPVQPLHGFKKGLDIFGQIIRPDIEQRLRYRPQSEYAKNLKAVESDVAAEQGLAAAEAKTEEEKARAGEETARAEALQHPQPKTKTPEEQAFEGYLAKGMNPTEAFRKVKADAESAKPEKTPNDFEQYYKDYLTENNLPDSAHNRLLARKEYAAAGQAPERPQRALMMVPQPDGSQKAVEVTPGMTVAGTAAKPGEAATANRKDVAAHDKAYVQPAESVEKSYQMMNSAFNEYEAARKQGKELPTGAQSMLALSTHLSTTFGNVKGARVTKDMIHEHLGARSIPDAALVAFQRLTNGDVLSPEQWKAFHDLISESRKLSWQQAAKEADRKHIPVDFLPNDLQNVAHEPGQQEAELAPPKEADPGMKWQHRTVNNKVEWRQVAK